MTSLFIPESALLIVYEPDYIQNNQEVHNYDTKQAVKVHVKQSSLIKVKNSPVQNLQSSA